MRWLIAGVFACGADQGAEWAGRYDVAGYESSPACKDEWVEAQAPADALAVGVSASHLDVLLCDGQNCEGPWWSGWVDSIGPKRVQGSVSQALGSPSVDGTPLCSVAWSSVLMEKADESGAVTLTGEVWQADSVPLEPHFDCWEVLDAYAETSDAPCVGAWRFSLVSSL